jgi:hypothetical protein
MCYWERLQQQFCQELLFSGKSPEITLSLQQIKKKKKLMNFSLYIILLYVLNMSTSFIIVFTHPLLDYLWYFLLLIEAQKILMILRNLGI